MAAQNGSCLALCVCCRLYAAHALVGVSAAEVFRWAQVATDHGYAPGVCQLGEFYEAGLGTQRSTELANSCYERAYELGYGFAAYLIAMREDMSTPGLSNSTDSLSWLVKASALGVPLAAYELAKRFEFGEGVAPDGAKAAHWYSRASELGSFFASSRLSQAYGFGDLGLESNADLSDTYAARAAAQIGHDENMAPPH